MKLRLTYALVIAGVVSLACATTVVVLMASFMTASATSQTQQAYAATSTTLKGATNALQTDLQRMIMYTNQTMFLIRPQFSRLQTSQQALDAWNATLFNQWAPRLFVDGETYGFAVNYVFPRGTVNGTAQYDLQSIETYTDVLRGGVPFRTHTYTDPTSNANLFYNFYYDPATGPQLSQTGVYQFKLRAGYFLRLINKAAWFDFPANWAAADGNPYWFFTYSMWAVNSLGVSVFAHTYQSSLSWGALLQKSIGGSNNENLYLLNYDGAVVTSSDVRIQQFISACAANQTSFNAITSACAGMPFSAFPGFARIAAVVGQWIANNQSSVIAEAVDDRGSARIVNMIAAFDRDNLHLRLVYVGDRPPPDNSTQIVFGAMMALTMFTVLINFVGLALLLQPLRRAAADMTCLADLNFEAVKEGSRSVVAETDDVLQSTNALVGAVESFTRYMSLGLVRQLMKSGEIASVGTRVVPLVVMFADIVGFTEMCSTMSVDEVMSTWLTQFFDVCSRAVLATDGTVDKFIGDCVMAFWGAPSPHGCASTAALCAALEIHEKLKHAGTTGDLHRIDSFSVTATVRRRHKLQIKRETSRARKASPMDLDELNASTRSDASVAVSSVAGDSIVAHRRDDVAVVAASSLSHSDGVVRSIRTRVGINAGQAHVGNVGCEQRLSYTALGDTVNVASRLEAYNKEVSRDGVGILITKAVMEDAPSALIYRAVGPVVLIGKSSAVDVYTVVGIDSDALVGHMTPKGGGSAAGSGGGEERDAMTYLRRLYAAVPSASLLREDATAAAQYNAAISRVVAASWRGAEDDGADAASEATRLSTGQPKSGVIAELRVAGTLRQGSK